MNTLEGKGLSQWHREHLKSIVICEEIVDSFPLFERLPLCIHMIERKGAGVWCPMKRRQIATMHHIVKCAMPLLCIECMIMAGAEHR